MQRATSSTEVQACRPSTYYLISFSGKFILNKFWILLHWRKYIFTRLLILRSNFIQYLAKLGRNIHHTHNSTDTDVDIVIVNNRIKENVTQHYTTLFNCCAACNTQQAPLRRMGKSFPLFTTHTPSYPFDYQSEDLTSLNSNVLAMSK